MQKKVLEFFSPEEMKEFIADIKEIAANVGDFELEKMQYSENELLKFNCIRTTTNLIDNFASRYSSKLTNIKKNAVNNFVGKPLC